MESSSDKAIVALEARLERSEHRLRVLSALLTLVGAAAFIPPFMSPAIAQGYGVTLAQLARR